MKCIKKVGSTGFEAVMKFFLDSSYLNLPLRPMAPSSSVVLITERDHLVIKVKSKEEKCREHIQIEIL